MNIKLTEQLRIKLINESKRRNVPVDELVRDAISRYLKETSEPAWVKSFGAFKDSREETMRIQAVIDEEFSRVDPRDWQ